MLAVSSSSPAHGSLPLPGLFRAQVGRTPSEAPRPSGLLSEDMQPLTFVQAAATRCRWTCGLVRGSRVFTQVCHMCRMQRTAETKASRVTLTIWARDSYM